MANTKQAAKRARQAEKRRVSNRWQKSKMNTFIKRVIEAVSSANLEKAREEYREAASILDKHAMKGLIPRNKAARHKSRLNVMIKSLFEKQAAA